MFSQISALRKQKTRKAHAIADEALAETSADGEDSLESGVCAGEVEHNDHVVSERKCFVGTECGSRIRLAVGCVQRLNKAIGFGVEKFRSSSHFTMSTSAGAHVHIIAVFRHHILILPHFMHLPFFCLQYLVLAHPSYGLA